jgi:hypothetical protein
MSEFAEHGALSEGSDDGTMTPESTTGYRTTQAVRHALPRIPPSLQALAVAVRLHSRVPQWGLLFLADNRTASTHAHAAKCAEAKPLICSGATELRWQRAQPSSERRWGEQ